MKKIIILLVIAFSQLGVFAKKPQVTDTIKVVKPQYQKQIKFNHEMLYNIDTKYLDNSIVSIIDADVFVDYIKKEAKDKLYRKDFTDEEENVIVERLIEFIDSTFSQTNELVVKRPEYMDVMYNRKKMMNDMHQAIFYLLRNNFFATNFKKGIVSFYYKSNKEFATEIIVSEIIDKAKGRKSVKYNLSPIKHEIFSEGKEL